MIKRTHFLLYIIINKGKGALFTNRIDSAFNGTQKKMKTI